MCLAREEPGQPQLPARMQGVCLVANFVGDRYPIAAHRSAANRMSSSQRLRHRHISVAMVFFATPSPGLPHRNVSRLPPCTLYSAPLIHDLLLRLELSVSCHVSVQCDGVMV